MSHFAKVNADNLVIDVIRAEQNFINSLPVIDGIRWIQTSYNTRQGVHILGGTPLRKNYASVGFIYDPVRDAFIPPKQYSSWVLNEDTCCWEPPFPPPDDGKIYIWNPYSNNWTEWGCDGVPEITGNDI